jgi:hypothetical protein
VHLSRALELEALPPVGATLRVGGDKWRVDHVHYNADDNKFGFVLLLSWTATPAQQPKNLAELEPYCTRFADAGWTRVVRPHLHLVE